MVNGTTALLNLSQTTQALSLAGDNLKFIKNKKKKTKGIVGQTIKNIVGLELIKVQGKIIKSL